MSLVCHIEMHESNHTIVSWPGFSIQCFGNRWLLTHRFSKQWYFGYQETCRIRVLTLRVHFSGLFWREVFIFQRNFCFSNCFCAENLKLCIFPWEAAKGGVRSHRVAASKGKIHSFKFEAQKLLEKLKLSWKIKTERQKSPEKCTRWVQYTNSVCFQVPMVLCHPRILFLLMPVFLPRGKMLFSQDPGRITFFPLGRKTVGL